MSNRFNHGITSSLFMREPVPIKRDKNVNNGKNSQSEYLVKGSDDKITYEHVGGEGDVFLVKSGSNAFQLHRANLKENLQELKKFSNLQVKQLEPKETELFRNVVEALRLLYGSKDLYQIVLKDIHEVFSDATDVKPGSVSAFFVGCFNDDEKFVGSIGCSPKCTSNLPPPDGTPGYSNCEDLVLIYDDGLFHSLNDKRSKHVFIYMGEGDFYGFSEDNIKQLKDSGIEKASLIYGNPDGSYREVTSPMTIDDLPTENSTTSNTDDNNNGAGIVLIIVLIAIVVLLAILFYRYYTKKM